MKKQNLILSTIAAMSLTVSGLSFAVAPTNQSTENPRQFHHKRGQFKKLSKEQRQQVRAIMQSHKADFKALHSQARELNQKLQSTIKQDNTTMKDLQPTIDQLKQVESQKTQLKVQIRFEVYKKTGILLPLHKHHDRKHRFHKRNAS